MMLLMLTKRKKKICATIIAAVLVTGLVGFTVFHLSADDTPQVKDEWYPVNFAEIQNTLGLAGHIEAASKMTLTAPFDGVVKEVNAAAGDRVSAGDIIFTMDTSQVDIRVRSALTDVLKAKREVSRIEHWKSTPEISRLRRQVRSAAALLKNTQGNLSETSELYGRGIVSRNELDAIRLQVQTQIEDLQNAKDDLALAESGADGDNQKIAVMALTNAQAQYDLLNKQASQAVVRAPFSGVLLQATLSGGNRGTIPVPGQQMLQGSPVFSLTGLEHFKVMARVQENDTRFLKEGMAVNVNVEGMTGRVFSGQLTHISLENANNGGMGGAAEYDVTASMSVPAADLNSIRLGMSANLEVATYYNPRGITVPPQALMTDSEGKSYVVYRRSAGDKTQRVYIIEGNAVAAGTEVDGLAPGEVLIAH
jgi:HlyD family secretion protein